MVLYADSKVNDKGKAEYFLQTFGEGLSAKCPPDIFGEGVINLPNNGKDVLEAVVKFAE